MSTSAPKGPRLVAPGEREPSFEGMTQRQRQEAATLALRANVAALFQAGEDDTREADMADHVLDSIAMLLDVGRGTLLDFSGWLETRRHG